MSDSRSPKIVPLSLGDKDPTPPLPSLPMPQSSPPAPAQPLTSPRRILIPPPPTPTAAGTGAATATATSAAAAPTGNGTGTPTPHASHPHVTQHAATLRPAATSRAGSGSGQPATTTFVRGTIRPSMSSSASSLNMLSSSPPASSFCLPSPPAPGSDSSPVSPVPSAPPSQSPTATTTASTGSAGSTGSFCAQQLQQQQLTAPILGTRSLQAICAACPETSSADLGRRKRTTLVVERLRVGTVEQLGAGDMDPSPRMSSPNPPLSPTSVHVPAPPIVPGAAAGAAGAAKKRGQQNQQKEVSCSLMYSERESDLIQDVLHLLITRHPVVVKEMFMRAGDRVADFADSIITMTFAKSTTLSLLRYFIVDEFEANSLKGENNTFFRENSIASRVFKSYLQKVGTGFLKELLWEMVYEVCVREQKISYEIDPERLSSSEERQHNQELLLSKIDLFIKKITSRSTVDRMPQGIRVLVGYFDELAKTYFPDKSPAAIVGSFLMLRFINPAILAPEAAGLLPSNKVLSAKVRRNLLLITKVLQAMSNGVLFSAKEQFMFPLNNFVEANMAHIQRFFREIVETASTCSANLIIDSDLCTVTVKELHLLHRVLFETRDIAIGLIPANDDEARRDLVHRLDALGPYSRKISFASSLDSTEQEHVRTILSKYGQEAMFVSRLAVPKAKKPPKQYILVVGMTRILLLRRRPPKVVGGSLVVREGHILDLLEIISVQPKVVSLVFKTMDITGESEQADEIIHCIRRAWLLNFSGIPPEFSFSLNVQPQSRLEVIPVTGESPCGGFAVVYRALCDYYGTSFSSTLCWDTENLFQGNTTFDLKLFFSQETGETSSATAGTSEFVPIFHALRHNDYFERLVIEDCRLHNSATVAALAELLRHNSKLSSITITNVGLPDRDFETLLDAMCANPKCAVVNLNLRGNELDERALGALGRFCVSMAAKGGVKCLGLRSACQNQRAISSLAAGLTTAAKAGPPSMERLDLSLNKLGDAVPALGLWLTVGGSTLKELNIAGTSLVGTRLTSFLQCIAKSCKELTKINLSDLKFAKQEEVLFVSQLLVLSTSLQSVNLSGSVCSAGSLHALLATSKQDTALHLNLSRNSFPGDIVQAFQNTLPKMSTITSLDLSGTDIGDDGIFHLAEGLTLNTFVTALNINGCFRTDRRPRDEVARALFKLACSDCPLETLLMTGGPRGAQQMGRYMIPFFQALITNTTLKQLDVSGHQIGSRGAIALAKGLQLNSTLTELRVDENAVGLVGLVALDHALSTNKTLTTLPLPVIDVSCLLRDANPELQKKITTICASIECSICANNSDS